MKIYNPANFSKNGMFKNLDENIKKYGSIGFR